MKCIPVRAPFTVCCCFNFPCEPEAFFTRGLSPLNPGSVYVSSYLFIHPFQCRLFASSLFSLFSISLCLTSCSLSFFFPVVFRSAFFLSFSFIHRIPVALFPLSLSIYVVAFSPCVSPFEPIGFLRILDNFFCFSCPFPRNLLTSSTLFLRSMFFLWLLILYSFTFWNNGCCFFLPTIDLGSLCLRFVDPFPRNFHTSFTLYLSFMFFFIYLFIYFLWLSSFPLKLWTNICLFHQSIPFLTFSFSLLFFLLYDWLLWSQFLDQLAVISAEFLPFPMMHVSFYKQKQMKSLKTFLNRAQCWVRCPVIL